MCWLPLSEGDALALQALTEVGRVLGIIMSACTVILNPVAFCDGRRAWGWQDTISSCPLRTRS